MINEHFFHIFTVKNDVDDDCDDDDDDDDGDNVVTLRISS